jgi:hypothetical protein
MAITETRNLPAPFIQSLGEYYGKELPALTKDKMDVAQWAPTVAGQDPLQTQAATLRGISDRAVQAGAFGGARHGIAGSEYDAASDMQRAQLQAGLLQQGYGQAQQGAQTAFNQQQQLAQTVPGMYQQDIATLGTVGATQQAQAQAVSDADREKLRMQAYEPYERLGFLGQGLTGIMGGYGNQYQFQQQPNPTPLQTALGTGATLAGIYGALQPGSQMSSIPLMQQNR